MSRIPVCNSTEKENGGKEIEFEHLDTVSLNDNLYVVLLEVLENGEENDEVVIFRIEQTDDEDDALVVIEDEAELNAVFEEFQNRLEDE